MDFREALADVAAAVDRLIAADPFPETVAPDYLAAAVRDYPARGGKRLRPALVCWSGGLFGAELLRPGGGGEERRGREGGCDVVFHFVVSPVGGCCWLKGCF